MIELVLRDGTKAITEITNEEFMFRLERMNDIAFIPIKDGWNLHVREISKYKMDKESKSVGEK